MDWKLAPEHNTTNGDWWYVQGDKTIKLFVPAGQKMWKATINSKCFYNPYSNRVQQARWHTVEQAKKDLELWVK